MWRYLLMSPQTLNLVLVDFYLWLDVTYSLAVGHVYLLYKREYQTDL